MLYNLLMIKKIFAKFFEFFGYYFAIGFLKTHNKFIREGLTFNLIKEHSLEQQKKSYEHFKPYLTPGCVILFDELHNFFGWENGAYKALNEVYSTNEYNFLSFTKFEQAAIKIK